MLPTEPGAMCTWVCPMQGVRVPGAWIHDWLSEWLIGVCVDVIKGAVLRRDWDWSPRDCVSELQTCALCGWRWLATSESTANTSHLCARVGEGWGSQYLFLVRLCVRVGEDWGDQSPLCHLCCQGWEVGEPNHFVVCMQSWVAVRAYEWCCSQSEWVCW